MQMKHKPVIRNLINMHKNHVATLSSMSHQDGVANRQLRQAGEKKSHFTDTSFIHTNEILLSPQRHLPVPCLPLRAS